MGTSITESKICGLSTAEGVEAALAGGATYLGFVFFPKSPRCLTVDQARPLFALARGRARTVALTVDSTDVEVAAIVEALAPDLIQLHGSETPERVAELKAVAGGTPVIKALPVSSAEDLDAAEAYEVADYLMFDAKPPKGADRPGGHGRPFDWSLLKGRVFKRPWFLAGGLDPGNVAQAVRQSGAVRVDVSSGVESGAGCKDPALISAFLDAVRRA